MAFNMATAAEDDLARLDERLSNSPLRGGWISRTDFLDACANLYFEGDLVSPEDLVLHDERMDVRAPTHELTRTHMMLRARRRIFTADRTWAMKREAVDVLLGREVAAAEITPPEISDAAADGAVDAEMAAIDALLARSTMALLRHKTGAPAPVSPSEARDRFALWQQRIIETEAMSPVEAAANAVLAWQDLRPIENADWLGRLLAANLLRIRLKTRFHLCTINIGLKFVPQQERRSADRAVRLAGLRKGFRWAAETGMRDHDRWLLALGGLQRSTRNRRSTSHLPQLVELVIAKPLVTTALIAAELKVSQRSARDLVAQLNLKELTGRGRYQAWGIL